MPGPFPLQDVGDFVTGEDGNASASSGAPSLITAAGGLDALKVTGATVDRRASAGIGIAHSAFICTGFLAALDTAETLSLAHEYQDSADDSTWNTAVVIEASTVKATAASAGNERGVDEHKLALTALLRYVRINVTPDLSRGGTDTALFFTVVVLGGWTQVPAT